MTQIRPTLELHSRAGSIVGVTSPFQWSRHRKQFWRKADKKTQTDIELAAILNANYFNTEILKVWYPDASGIGVSGNPILMTKTILTDYLYNEEKLEHECHVDMWISIPEVTNAQDVLPPDDVSRPQQTGSDSTQHYLKCLMGHLFALSRWPKLI